MNTKTPKLGLGARVSRCMAGVALAVVVLGFAAGCNPSGSTATGKLTTLEGQQRQQILAVQKAVAKIAKEKKIEPFEVDPKDVLADKEITKLGLEGTEGEMTIRSFRDVELDSLPPIQDINSYKPVLLGGKTPKLKEYTMAVPGADGDPKFLSVDEVFSSKPVVFEVTIAPKTDQPGMQPPQTQVVGPMTKATLDELIKKAADKVTVTVGKEYPVELRMDGKGRLALVVLGGFNKDQNLSPMQYFTYKPETVEKYFKIMKSDPKAAMPPQKRALIAFEDKPVSKDKKKDDKPIEMPKVEAPKTEAPKAEAPKAGSPKGPKPVTK